MFTGIVADLGAVETVEELVSGRRLVIRTSLASELEAGESIAVDGVCLTATDRYEGRFAAEVAAETLDRTTLATAVAGSAVNLELPLRASQRLGGHLVQGHVDCLGTVRSVASAGIGRAMRIEPDSRALLRYVVERNSIAVDGVSLTVTDIDGDSFGVSLIPETVKRTRLGSATAGTRVNLEVDMMAKYLEKLLYARIAAAAAS